MGNRQQSSDKRCNRNGAEPKGGSTMRLENDQRTGDKTAQSPLERDAPANQRNEVQPQPAG